MLAQARGGITPKAGSPDIGYSLRHTELATGKQTNLVISGSQTIPSVAAKLSLSRIVGIAQNDELLCVLLWVDTLDGIHNSAPWVRDGYDNFVYRVFRKRTGEEILLDYVWAHPWPGMPERFKAIQKRLPKQVPAETLSAGPLKMLKDDIECFGVRLHISRSVFHPPTRSRTQPPRR